MFVHLGRHQGLAEKSFRLNWTVQAALCNCKIGKGKGKIIMCFTALLEVDDDGALQQGIGLRERPSFKHDAGNIVDRDRDVRMVRPKDQFVGT